MKHTFLLAWRNIWRNRRRTLISMSAIGVGLCLVVFYTGLVGGVMADAKTQLDNTGMGHIEIFATGFHARRDVAHFMTNVPQLNLPSGSDVTMRVLARGLATSARGNEAVQIFGVDWSAEKTVTAHLNSIVEGTLPKSEDASGVLIGEQLAKRLGLKIGSKMRLMVQRADNEMGADLFRIRGIYHSISANISQRQVYVSQTAARELLGVENAVHQVVIQLPTVEDTDKIAQQLKNSLGQEKYDVLTWGELLPVLKRMDSLISNVVTALAIFVYLLVGLGVLNTMLMSVLERTREFGVLMSLGTKAKQIIGLVLAESFWIGTVSVILGGILGASLNWYFSQKGLRMGGNNESYSISGATISTLIKTRFNPIDVIRASGFVYVMALIVGLYPAWRVSKLRPAEALRRT